MDLAGFLDLSAAYQAISHHTAAHAEAVDNFVDRLGKKRKLTGSNRTCRVSQPIAVSRCLRRVTDSINRAILPSDVLAGKPASCRRFWTRPIPGSGTCRFCLSSSIGKSSWTNTCWQAMQNVVEDLYGHVHRVADLACALGRTMMLRRRGHRGPRPGRESFTTSARSTSTLPSSAKPGPLDDLERDHMRRHPELGYAMINERFDRRVSEAILYHHERYDGGGYPFGLAGPEIPLLSRVVFVADAFDAITNHRSYQPALSVEFAIQEITDNAGTQFDPGVVEAFLMRCRQRQPALSAAARPAPLEVEAG